MPQQNWNERRRLTNVEAAWVACAIDCEGTVCIHVPWSKPGQCRCVQVYTRVNMVKEVIPRRLHALCGGSIKSKVRMQGPNRRPQCYWNISANGLRWLLPQILPFMLEKRRHAEIQLEVLKRNSRAKSIPNEDLLVLLTEIRALNTKGLQNRPAKVPAQQLRRPLSRIG